MSNDEQLKLIQTGNPAILYITFFQIDRSFINPNQQIFNPPLNYPIELLQSIRMIHRIMDYNCPLNNINPYKTSPLSLLDTTFYQLAYPNQILEFCQTLQEYQIANPIDNTIHCFSTSSYYIIKHYQFKGHQLRYQPNSNCFLTPNICTK